MACSCQGNKATPPEQKTYTVTAKDGKKTSYRSEVEAAAAAKRQQGSYQPGVVAPRLLDLFCGVGGAGMGYRRAGFDITGVDLRRQPRYPGAFIHGDALEYLQAHGHEYDAIHASPPCQAHTKMQNWVRTTVEHDDLVGITRSLLIDTGKPWVIENVPGAPLYDHVQLCGTEFGLAAPDTDGVILHLRRHRWFESNQFLWGAGGCQHDPNTVTGSVFGSGSGWGPAERDSRWRPRGYVPITSVCAALLGIDWTTQKRELSQAVPPAYTEYIGTQLLGA